MLLFLFTVIADKTLNLSIIKLCSYVQKICVTRDMCLMFLYKVSSFNLEHVNLFVRYVSGLIVADHDCNF